MTSILKRDRKQETSLVVQQLQLCAPNAGGPDSIPSQETKILPAKKIGKKKKRNHNDRYPYKRQTETEDAEAERPETMEGEQKRDVASSKQPM